MFEVFNRLNTGGINLKPQEIRTSMYHSEFYNMLYNANSWGAWRRLLGGCLPDLHMKDVEILLRGFAMLIDVNNYAPSMVRFLNQFAQVPWAQCGAKHLSFRSAQIVYGFLL